MMNLDERRLAGVVDAALLAVKGDKRWTNAILKAKEILVANDFIHFDGARLVVWSSSGEVYEANGACQCEAFKRQQPCCHRAAYKLMVRYSAVGAKLRETGDFTQ